MKRVFKYSFLIDDTFKLLLPKDAEILSVQVQNDWPQMWVLVYDANITNLEYRYFRLAGTAHVIEEAIKTFIGTFQMQKGALVYHLFEVDGDTNEAH